MPEKGIVRAPSRAEQGDLRDLLAEVLRWAEIGFFLRDARASSYGDRYSQPEELTIQWDWQQSTPDDRADGALHRDVNAFLAELEEDPDPNAWVHPVLRARALLRAQASAEPSTGRLDPYNPGAPDA